MYIIRDYVLSFIVLSNNFIYPNILIIFVTLQILQTRHVIDMMDEITPITIRLTHPDLHNIHHQ